MARLANQVKDKIFKVLPVTLFLHLNVFQPVGIDSGDGASKSKKSDQEKNCTTLHYLNARKSLKIPQTKYF